MKFLKLFFLSLVLCSYAQASPTFFYVATTVDVNGLESVYSKEVSVLLDKSCGTPPEQCTKVILTWTAPVVTAGGAAIAGYNVYRGSASGGPYIKINSSLFTGTTCTDPFVPPSAPSLLPTTKQ